jgi:hypothetical protein
VEASRKHGSFDMRWPRPAQEGSGARLSTAPLLSAAETAEGLDWTAFSGRHFREGKRHDPEGRSAYAAYRRGREWRIAPARLSPLVRSG